MLAADVVYVDEWTTLFAKAAALLLQTPAELQPPCTGRDTGTPTPAATTAAGGGCAAPHKEGPPGQQQQQQQQQQRVLYLTIERRINFHVGDVQPTCKAYQHFEEQVVRNTRFVAQRLPLDFPHCFMGFERTPQLELWRITAAV